MQTMRERMKLREKENPDTFEMIRNIFGMDEHTHGSHKATVQQSIVEGTSKWSAKIAITGERKQLADSH